MDPTDKIIGEAFGQVASQELCEKTLGKKKERKGHRYTEEFKSSQEGVKSFSDHSLKFMSVQWLGFMTTLAQPGGILALSNKWA